LFSADCIISGHFQRVCAKPDPMDGSEADLENDEFPYSTLPIFFTAATRRALSVSTNFENSGASM
jgi:hypothetical protein